MTDIRLMRLRVLVDGDKYVMAVPMWEYAEDIIRDQPYMWRDVEKQAEEIFHNLYGDADVFRLIKVEAPDIWQQDHWVKRGCFDNLGDLIDGTENATGLIPRMDNDWYEFAKWLNTIVIWPCDLTAYEILSLFQQEQREKRLKSCGFLNIDEMEDR